MPVEGWFKLLTQEEGEFYNVPVPEEGADLAALKYQMRVRKIILSNTKYLFLFSFHLSFNSICACTLGVVYLYILNVCGSILRTFMQNMIMVYTIGSSW